MPTPSQFDYVDFGSPNGAGTALVAKATISAAASTLVGPFDVSPYRSVVINFAPNAGAPTSYVVSVDNRTSDGAGLAFGIGGPGIMALGTRSVLASIPVYGSQMAITFLAQGGSVTIGGTYAILGSQAQVGCLTPGILIVNSTASLANGGVQTVDAAQSIGGLATLESNNTGAGPTNAYVQMLTSAGAFQNVAGVSIPTGSFFNSMSFVMPPGHARLAISNNSGAAEAIAATLTVA